MSEKPQATPSQAVYIVITAAIFLVAGLVIATLLNQDSVSQDDVNTTVNEAIGTRTANIASQADVQALADAVSTRTANSASQADVQALADAVSTRTADSASHQDIEALAAVLSTRTADSAGDSTGDQDVQALVEAFSTLSANSASQQDIQALVDQAVGTQVAALRPTETPIPPTATPIPLETAAGDDAFLGAADAKVTIVEFADFQCGYCARWAQEVLPEITAKYPTEVKFVFRDFTIFGEDSIRAAAATECAEETGHFWEMHNALFESFYNGGTIALDEDSLVNEADDLGIDKDDFRECLSSQRYLDEIVEDATAAQTWGFGGTPGFIINGVVYAIGAQSFEVFDGLIQDELAKVG